MATTFAHYNQGPASTIQSTTWNPVIADYTEMKVPQVSKWISERQSEGCRVDGMPQSEKGIAESIWFARTDTSAGYERLRGLLALKVSSVSYRRRGLRPSDGATLESPFQKYTVQATVYAVCSVTPSAGAVYLDVLKAGAFLDVLVDPESPALLTTNLHQLVDEAVGMIVRRNAGAVPTYEHLSRAIGWNLPPSA